MNLFNGARGSKFLTKKWSIFNSKLKDNYAVGNKIIYNTEVLKADICD